MDDRRRSPRYETQLQARLLFSIVLTDPDAPTGNPTRTLNLVGHTRDISAVGLALVVPVAEIDEVYLAGENTLMQLELYLPGGAIEIQARPVRFRRFTRGEGQSIFDEGYIIGADITEVSDRERFLQYLRTLA